MIWIDPSKISGGPEALDDVFSCLAATGSDVSTPRTLGGDARCADGRAHVLLVRDGWAINIKRTRRLYNELDLQLRNKTPKRRVKAKLRED